MKTPGLSDKSVSSLTLPASLEWAHRLDHAVYDCAYLALALHLDGTYVTAERRFWQKARARDVGSSCCRTALMAGLRPAQSAQGMPHAAKRPKSQSLPGAAANSDLV